MEGLIPLVYKTVKKNSRYKKYKCLSTGRSNFGTSEFYPDNKYDYKSTLPDHHRRNSSIGEYSTGDFPSPEAKQKIVRFRSHRFFSCVGGT